MRRMVPCTTPGETLVSRGMFAECLPHGQSHFSWGPRLLPDRSVQPCCFSARTTSRFRISLYMTVV